MSDWLRHISSPKISLLTRADEVRHSFSASGRSIFYLLAGLIILSASALLFLFDRHFTVEVPARGGTFTEGEIGSPRFLNPVLAISDADHDLDALIYSGLLKASPDGNFVPDLAEKYDISEDGLTYTVTLRPDARFQDGSQVTADDVIYTVQEALDPSIKSPLRANWDGVTATALDPQTVQFTLHAPYAPFIENLTMGILPKHLWQDVSAEEFPFSNLNSMPVGSGPYRVTNVERTSSGIPSVYHLQAFSDYSLGEPYITHFIVRLYQNEEALVSALKNGQADSGSGISPASLSGWNAPVLTAPENRVFAVFFNQNQNAALRDVSVRKALSDAVDRNALVAAVLGGYGTPADGPIPPGMTGASSSVAAVVNPDEVQAELTAAGWTKGADGMLQKTSGTGKSAQTQTLSITLSTGNIPELTGAAAFLKSTWEKLGVSVDVQVFNQGDLSQNVIRPRKYDALLFGEIVGRALDLFAFWHSSQRNDPGLNVALYANTNADSVLVKLREAQDEAERQTLYTQFETEIAKDYPAVFLYAPDFLYVFPSSVQGMTLPSIENPSDRFMTVQKWYVDTDHVWTIFSK